jgi:hypothetical protein
MIETDGDVVDAFDIRRNMDRFESPRMSLHLIH